ncbi:hypothetical protein [Microbacterium sp.]|uniref:hypothetical protein n=1 Tax=Microbacterium sp. TaxID=51671 RepID=UPI0026278FB3|nr:hypothetical protein [Microbacterium sp.]
MHLLRPVVATFSLWAIAAFMIAAAGLPQMHPQCYSDSPTGGRVCPLHRDPVLTHLFDVRWPSVSEAVTVSVILVAMLLGITVLGAVLLLLGLLGLRAFLGALRRRYSRHLRREHLREHGNRTVARITCLGWQQAYQNDDAVFTLTAQFSTKEGIRSVTDELCVPRKDAPVLGGTVVVIHDDEAGHPTSIDVLLEMDPDGLRDPNALEKYPPAPEASPS